MSTKITEASEYLGVSINTLKTLANNGKINSFKPEEEKDKNFDVSVSLKITAKSHADALAIIEEHFKVNSVQMVYEE